MNAKKNALLLFVITLTLSYGCQNAGARSTEYSAGTSLSIAENSESIEKSAKSLNHEYIRGMWVSQFDMHYIYCDKGAQRDKESYTALVKTMLYNIKKDNFNTVYLQLRPNGDSMYESALFPISRYVSGAYGKDIAYDAVEVFINEAHDRGISVHGWINPLRLMKPAEIEAIDDNYAIKRWYKQGNGRVVLVGDRLYLNPAYNEVRQLIIDGVGEILRLYPFDGIHMDDYFYPTTDVDFDKNEFMESGYEDVGDFRRNNINMLVRGLYETVKNTGKDRIYSVSPGGNLNSMRDYHYADVILWCSESGYIDYIMPQLYYGFKNRSCPFDKTLADWAGICVNPDVGLVIGLTAAKAVLAVSGELDVWAGTEEGKREWINEKDILKRSLIAVYSEGADGYCFFCYQYFYDVLTGEPNIAFGEERENIGDLLDYLI